MRGIALLACLAAAAVCSAQDRVTVEKLEQRIAAAQGRSDQDIARRLEKLQLTQRLSNARLIKLQAALPGPESRNALLAVADLSEVLDPPPGEIASDPPPSAEEQQEMLARAHDASGPSADQMPDFDATVNITRFRNLKHLSTANTVPIVIVTPVPLLFSSGNDMVTHRDGRIFITQVRVAHALEDSVKAGIERWDGLHSLLKDVLEDMDGVQPVWTRWEQGDTGKLAVFRFSVDEHHAHFPIRTVMEPESKRGFVGNPGYHAEIALDPTSGAVHRMVLRAMLSLDQHVSRADAIVEFGSVNVDGKTFLAPLRTVTIGLSQSFLGYDDYYSQSMEVLMGPGLEAFMTFRPLMHVVDVEFTAYRAGFSKAPRITDAAFLAAALNVPGERVTAEQLEKIVANLDSNNDAAAAKHLGELNLTQRLTAERYERMRSRLPGKASSDALLALYDLAAFNDLPSSDLVPDPAPDTAAQGKIFSTAVEFAGRAMYKMPDLFATRELARFEDLQVVRGVPQPLVAEDRPLAVVDQSNGTVHFRDGKEIIEQTPKGVNAKPRALGLSTWGTFGPILESTIGDILHAKIGWSHWENGASGKLAVFRFAVPDTASHYDVRFCCYLAYDGLPSKFATTPGYHGEIAIDPQSGAVLRIVLKADLKKDPDQPVELDKSPLLRSDVLVDYGAVGIGGKQYICPVRAVSIMTSWTLGSEGPLKHTEFKAENVKKAKDAWERMEFSRVNAINEAVFRDYHVFRSEMRIVSDGSETSPTAPKQ